jgi:hypothetical protein
MSSRLLAAALFVPLCAFAADSESKKDAKHRAAQAAFFRGQYPTLRFELSENDLEELRKDPRRYIEARMVEGDKTFKGVALKLKGRDGSFQPVDERPGFTINLDKFKGADRFHGLRKFHLNNAREDPTFLRQLISGEMARAAGVPAVRCTHAFVKLNDRDLGLYVFTEGYTDDFLAQFFKNPEGDFYEGGFCKDIDEELQKDRGDKDDFRAIEQLLAACREDDPAARWKKLGAILDTERFASFLAIEALLGVGDGYDFFHNNYRLYHDPESGKLSFILHGMDQPLSEVDFGIQRSPESIVGRAFVGCAEGRALYRERVATLYEKTIAKGGWPARVGAVAARVREAVAARDPELAKEFAKRAEEFRGLVAKRVESIAQQLAELPEPLAFDKAGIARLSKGWATKYTDGASLDHTNADGHACLRIVAEGDAKASWRTGVELPRGRYRFEGRVKTRGVTGDGVGLRISGSDPQGESLTGDATWKSVNYEFSIRDDSQEVVLVAELRATKGEALFALDSLRLVRLGGS